MLLNFNFNGCLLFRLAYLLKKSDHLRFRDFALEGTSLSILNYDVLKFLCLVRLDSANVIHWKILASIEVNCTYISNLPLVKEFSPS